MKPLTNFFLCLVLTILMSIFPISSSGREKEALPDESDILSAPIHPYGWIKFNRWGINFSHPKSWREQSSDFISQVRSITEKNISGDNWASIDELTVFSSNDMMFSIIKTKIPITYTQYLYIKEKKDSLNKALLMGLIKKIVQLRGIMISGQPSVVEHVEGPKGNTIGYSILCEKSLYQFQFIIFSQSSLLNIENIINKLIKSIQLKKCTKKE